MSRFLTLLTAIFIGFKLAGVIDWSWWLVLSPIWILAVAWAGFWFFALWLMFGRKGGA